jgi:hypothetical protein
LKPFAINLDDLTIDEAILFAYRYRLIDDCHPEGSKMRLILGNQSLLFSPDELSVFLHSLLQAYERAIRLSETGIPPGRG